MKCSIIFLSVILLSAITHTKAIAQNDKFIGTWRIDMDRTLDIMDGDVKARYDTLSAEAHTRAVNAMKDREFVLKATGEISVKWRSPNGERTSVGRWSIDRSGKILSIIMDKRTVAYEVEALSQKEMVWKGKSKGGLFSNMYLRKI